MRERRNIMAFHKGNTPSYVLMKIEECIRVADSAKSVRSVVNQLYEASKYMAELQVLEKEGRYKGKPSSKEYIASFVQRKDRIIMAGIDRALAAGETKEKIMESKKFFSDEVIAFLKNK